MPVRDDTHSLSLSLSLSHSLTHTRTHAHTHTHTHTHIHSLPLSLLSLRFRLISRTIATFLYCQMPVDTTQRTQLRTLPSSPGHIKDHNRPPPRSNTNNLPPNTIIPTKLADSSFHNLETLQTNKHYATYRERVVWCVEYVSNPVHCIMNTGELLVELCTEVYSQYRFLDLMRVLQK